VGMETGVVCQMGEGLKNHHLPCPIAYQWCSWADMGNPMDNSVLGFLFLSSLIMTDSYIPVINDLKR